MAGSGGCFLTAAQVIPMATNTRVLDNSGGAVYKSTASLSNLQNFDATAHSTYKTPGIVVNNGGTFYQSTSTLWSDVENAAFTAGNSPAAGLSANTSIVRLNGSGEYYKIKGDWGSSQTFPSSTSVNVGTTVKDAGGIFYKLDQAFLGNTSSVRNPSGANEWFLIQGHQNITAPRELMTVHQQISDPSKWDEFADFNAAVGGGLATNVNNDVRLTSTPVTSNHFWEKVTDDLTPGANSSGLDNHLNQ